MHGSVSVLCPRSLSPVPVCTGTEALPGFVRGKQSKSKILYRPIQKLWSRSERAELNAKRPIYTGPDAIDAGNRRPLLTADDQPRAPFWPHPPKGPGGSRWPAHEVCVCGDWIEDTGITPKCLPMTGGPEGRYQGSLSFAAAKGGRPCRMSRGVTGDSLKGKWS